MRLVASPASTRRRERISDTSRNMQPTASRSRCPIRSRRGAAATYHPSVTTLLDLFDAAVERFGDRPALALDGDGGPAFGLDVPRARAAEPACGVAAPCRGPRARRPDPHVVAGDAAAPRRVLRRDAGGARPRSARPADGARRDRADRRPGGREAADPRGGARTRPIHAKRASAISRRSGLDELTADADETFPADWEQQLDAWPRPADTDVVELIFTSGTTGTPKGVILAHDNIVASVRAMHRVVPPIEHRVVSLLPLSHLLEQAVALFYALDVGADVLYVRSRNPRVIFEAIRRHRTTSMVVVPQILELFWAAVEREVEQSGRATSFGRLRRIARHLPYALRRLMFRQVHAQARGRDSAVRRVPARSWRRRSSRPGRISGSSSSRATGRPRPASGRARPARTTGSGRSGGRCRRSRCGSPTTARSSSAGRPCSRATGTTPRRRRPPSPPTAGTGPATSGGWTTPGDSSSWAGRRTSSSCRTA